MLVHLRDHPPTTFMRMLVLTHANANARARASARACAPFVENPPKKAVLMPTQAVRGGGVCVLCGVLTNKRKSARKGGDVVTKGRDRRQKEDNNRQKDCFISKRTYETPRHRREEYVVCVFRHRGADTEL